MKSLVVYYSHFGNTAYVASRLQEALAAKGSADIFALEYADKKKSLARQFLYRTFPSLVNLAPIPTDLKEYDVLCLGIPVILGSPSPAFQKYISICVNLHNKKVICCYVYGIERDARNYAKQLEKILAPKINQPIISIFIHWGNVHMEGFISKAVNEAMAKLA